MRTVRALGRAWGAMSWTTRGVIVASVSITTYIAASGDDRAPVEIPAQRPAKLSPEAIAKRAAIDADIASAKARRENAVNVTQQFKAAMRDPSSVRWHSVAANHDGNIICIDYGAANGFGGINREQVVVIDYQVSKSAADWSKHCTKPTMYDVREFAP